MGAEFFRAQIETSLMNEKTIDTKEVSTDFCAIPGGRGGKFKWPTLTELHIKLFDEGFNEAHNASADVEATTRCFLELIRLKVISYKFLGLDDEYNKRYSEFNPKPFELLGQNIQPYSAIDQQEIDQKCDKVSSNVDDIDLAEMQDLSFSHLHCHSSYSVLQASCDISDIIAKAKFFEMPAVALTDTGNMYAAYKFVREAIKNDIKPILGCELYLTADHKIRKFTKENPDRRSTVVFLAKTQIGLP